MSERLNNKHILVTRPEHQAGYLCELISKVGGESILFPTIEIRSILDSKKLSDCFNQINNYDIVIFVSRNAVRVVMDHYINDPNLLESIQLLAIGTGTAAALTEKEMTNILHAGVQADSESLLQLSELKDEFVRNKKILIVRGVGGRELLANTLKERGALVEYAEVYERCLPEHDGVKSHEIWQQKKPDAIIVSSNEGLNNLLKLTLEDDLRLLFNTPLAVMSERSVTLAKELGFVADIEVANDKNDEGLLSSVLKLVGES